MGTPRARGGHSTTAGLCEGHEPGAAQGRLSPRLGSSQGSEPPKGRRPVDLGGRDSEGHRPGAHTASTDVSQIWSPRSECHPGWFLPRVSSWLAASLHVLTWPFLWEQRRHSSGLSLSFFIPPAMPHGLWGLSSPTREQTRALGPESGVGRGQRQGYTRWPAGWTGSCSRRPPPTNPGVSSWPSPSPCESTLPRECPSGVHCLKGGGGNTDKSQGSQPHTLQPRGGPRSGLATIQAPPSPSHPGDGGGTAPV